MESIDRFVQMEGHAELRALVCEHYADGGMDEGLEQRIDRSDFSADATEEIEFAIAVVANDCRAGSR